MSTTILSIDSDHNVVLENLKLETTDAFVNTATVTFSLQELDGSAISGATAVSMAFTGTNGQYRGLLTDTVTALLVFRRKYNLLVVADNGAGVRRSFRRDGIIAAYES